jgi:KUP system potassium uptake protein
LVVRQVECEHYRRRGLAGAKQNRLNFIDSAARPTQNSLTLTVGNLGRRSAITNLFQRLLVEGCAGELAPDGRVENEMSIEATGVEPRSVGRLGLAGVAALGVVFGDIGTSPLYTLKTVLDYMGPHPDRAATLGALSLIVWTLFLITTVKYINIAMRIDNDGEGGIIALMTLLGVKRHQRPLIVAAGLFGAALIYGDGAITPAISVLSALEGVEQIAPSLQSYVLPAASAILLGLFAIQPFGTAAIGRAFGPIMLTWFVVIAALGVHGIIQHRSLIAAINPLYGAKYLMSGGFKGFLVLACFSA